MKHAIQRSLAAVVFAFAAGCSGGGEGLVPVTGTVTVDGSEGGGVVVTYIPDAGTPGNGGTAVADSAGKYEMKTPQGKKGLPPGRYKVTISRRLNPDGSTPDPGIPPIESNARETLLARFSDPDKTELTATVTEGSGPVTFSVQSSKKKK